jgi:steroid 5-alpha reductase family enzyme
MNPQLQEVFLLSAGVVTVLMFLLWLISLWLRDASIVDLVWGMGFVLIAWTAFVDVSDRRLSNLLLPCLTTLWGLRLSVYLVWRNHGKPEDFRYQSMRSKWGKSFPLVSLLTVFGFQGFVMWFVSLPIQAGIALGNYRLIWLSAVGVMVWVVGLTFEAVGDWQLTKFKSNIENKGSVLDCGLWRYTRHPNYFGDFLIWWGLYLVALSQGAPWWTAVGPLTMSIFLMRVSGVTLLEKSLKATKPGYAEYVARTNAFFPGSPRS